VTGGQVIEVANCDRWPGYRGGQLYSSHCIFITENLYITRVSLFSETRGLRWPGTNNTDSVWVRALSTDSNQPSYWDFSENSFLQSISGLQQPIRTKPAKVVTPFC
jgi:hypothetical protein